MTAAQWSEVKRTFDLAVQLPRDEWAALVDRESADPEVRRQAVMLLDAHARASADFLPIGAGQERGIEPATLGSTALHGGADADESLLEPGTLLAERYRITKLIGVGGMGNVYSALDEVLHASVAVKTLRRERLRDPKGLERLRREVALARRVTNPNACRLHDFVRHDEVGQAPLHFLTMELLEGQTLAQRLRESGPLPADEALVIAGQLVSGLAAAHAAGIIHRDLKPSNILLSTKGDERRAVIMDFGIARDSSVDGLDGSRLTGSESILGTLEYMAPEQVLGGAVTSATDIHALGLVLFEMVTGRLPFEDVDRPQALLRRFFEKPQLARTLSPTLDARWDEAISRCLDRDPAKRPASAEAVLSLLGGETSIPAPRRMRRAVLALSAFVAAIVVVAGGVWLTQWLRHRGHAEMVGLPIATTTRPSIAFVPLAMLGGPTTPEWLATGVPEFVGSQLSASGRVRLIQGDRVARAAQEFGLNAAGALAAADLVRAGSRLAADILVLGTLRAEGPSATDPVRVELRLVNGRTGGEIGVLQETSSRSGIPALNARLSDRLRDALGVAAPGREESSQISALQPQRIEAMRAYSEGLEHVRSFELQAARASFATAVAADPTYALAHSALAAACTELGMDETARTEALAALDLAAPLPQRDRLLIEARYHATRADRPAAVKAYRQLVALDDDDPEARLLLAMAEKDARNYATALDIIDSIRADFPAMAHDPRMDLSEALVAFDATDLTRQEAAARRAADVANTSGERHLRAEALFWLGTALYRQGRHAEAAAAFNDSKNLFGLSGDRIHMADALRWWGHSSPGAAGRLAESRAVQEEGLRVYREEGSRRREVQALNAVANLEFFAGDLEVAKAHYIEAQGLYREAGWADSAAWVVASIASVLHQQGDLMGAQSRLESARSALEAAHMPLATVAFDSDLGRIALERDELDAAQRKFEEAAHAASAIENEGEFDAGLALNQALLLLERGRIDEALVKANAVAARARERGQRREEILGEYMRSRCFVAAGRSREARDAGDSAMKAAEGMEEMEPRMLALVAHATTRGKLTTREDARALEAGLTTVREKGSVSLELELGLALAAVEHSLGDGAAAKAASAEVERVATEHGFVRLARHARGG